MYDKAPSHWLTRTLLSSNQIKTQLPVYSRVRKYDFLKILSKFTFGKVFAFALSLKLINRLINKVYSFKNWHSFNICDKAFKYYLDKNHNIMNKELLYDSG